MLVDRLLILLLLLLLLLSASLLVLALEVGSSPSRVIVVLLLLLMLQALIEDDELLLIASHVLLMSVLPTSVPGPGQYVSAGRPPGLAPLIIVVVAAVDRCDRVAALHDYRGCDVSLLSGVRVALGHAHAAGVSEPRHAVVGVLPLVVVVLVGGGSLGVEALLLDDHLLLGSLLLVVVAPARVRVVQMMLLRSRLRGDLLLALVRVEFRANHPLLLLRVMPNDSHCSRAVNRVLVVAQMLLLLLLLLLQHGLLAVVGRKLVLVRHELVRLACLRAVGHRAPVVLHRHPAIYFHSASLGVALAVAALAVFRTGFTVVFSVLLM